MLRSLTLTRHGAHRAAASSAAAPTATGRGTVHRPALRDVPYHAWKILPPWCRRLAVRLCVPRVSLGVCAVIRDGHGRVLVAHHPYRAAWGLPGGFARGGEQPQAALEREIREELGVDAAIGPLLAAQTATDAGHLTLYYAATLAGAPRPDGLEIDALRHVTEDALPALLDTSALVWRTPAMERFVA